MFFRLNLIIIVKHNLKKTTWHAMYYKQSVNLVRLSSFNKIAFISIDKFKTFRKGL